jgi:hypothetical protein
MDLKEIFRLARPDAQEGEPWREHYGKWLASVVWAKAPERRIWERALWKAVDRAGELTPPRSQADRDRDNVGRLAAAMNPTVKPHCDPDTRALGRQGRPTTPPPKRP